MTDSFADAELEAFLDESLDPARATQIERAARDNPELLQRLSHINGRRDAGLHTVGEIWRRNQLSVPTREEMANYLLGVLTTEHADYIRFRMDVLKCPFTIALHKDLTQRQAGKQPQSEARRRKYFQSSAGLLRSRKDRE